VLGGGMSRGQARDAAPNHDQPLHGVGARSYTVRLNVGREGSTRCARR
jgi:hypothetical protein